jgi:uncharacterized protein (TIGR00369 family)
MTSPAPTDSSAEQTLAAWQAREAELHGRMLPPGLARPDQVAHLTGLQMFHAMLAGEIPPPPFARTLSFALVEVEAGKVTFQGRPKFEHYNPMGIVHGGWMATLLDSALGCAVHSRLPAGKAYTTLELKVNFVKALSDRARLVRAIGEIIHFGGRIATADARLVGADGTLYAHASTTCLIFDPIQR